MRLDYEYRYQLFDKNKFSLFEENELEKHSKAISEEKNRLFSEHLEGKSFFLEMMNKWDYKLDEIDQFIDEYKILYLSLNH